MTILVAYATQFGSTAGIATQSGMSSAHLAAAVVFDAFGTVEAIASYRAVVVGSAVHLRTSAA